MLEYQSQPFFSLTDDELSGWLDLFDTGVVGSSPFFHPRYAESLAAVGRPVHVVTFREADQLVGFWPYERHGRIGRPLGIKLCDFQGPVMRQDRSWSPERLLAATGLREIQFDHLVNTDNGLENHVLRSDASPWLDLSHGYEHYVATCRAQGSSVIPKTGTKARKLVREHGELEFEFDDRSPAHFQQILDWKSEQRKRTKTLDVLSWPWVQEFLSRLRQTNDSGFRGLLSTLCVDGKLIAGQFGLMSSRTVHYWFPAYNVEYSKFSPGLVFLFELAKTCVAEGVSRIDLGKGDDSYKQSLATASDMVGIGTLDRQPLRRACRKLTHSLREQVKRSRLKQFLHTPKRWVREFQLRRSMGGKAT